MLLQVLTNAAIGNSGLKLFIHDLIRGSLAKFWLKPVALASSTRFSPKDLRKLELLVVENKDIFLEAGNEHFSS
ncbi:MAG: DUF4160 domain-containing protein [Gammaproteobacteria bacterium]|nr:DUF4160 domain-containing protein [Gammaproteobacteria bacterium]